MPTTQIMTEEHIRDLKKEIYDLDYEFYSLLIDVRGLTSLDLIVEKFADGFKGIFKKKPLGYRYLLYVVIDPVEVQVINLNFPVTETVVTRVDKGMIGYTREEVMNYLIGMIAGYQRCERLNKKG